MDSRLQRRIQRYGWDRAASLYEELWARQIAPAQRMLLSMAGLCRDERVLDVACGTGLVTFSAAMVVGPKGAVVGTDISGGMVERARLDGLFRGIDQVRFVRSDAEALDVPEGLFDVALCSLGLMYFPDPVASLRQMRTALRPGGRVAVSVWGARSRCGWNSIFPIVDARVQSEVCPLFFQLGTGGALADALTSAGFEDVEVDRLSTSLHYSTEEEACAAAFAGGPVALAYSKFDNATREAAHAEYIASIAPYRNGEGFRIPGEFVVARATRGRPLTETGPMMLRREIDSTSCSRLP